MTGSLSFLECFGRKPQEVIHQGTHTCQIAAVRLIRPSLKLAAAIRASERGRDKGCPEQMLLLEARTPRWLPGVARAQLGTGARLQPPPALISRPRR